MTGRSVPANLKWLEPAWPGLIPLFILVLALAARQFDLTVIDIPIQLSLETRTATRTVFLSRKLL
jgi:hypothetical protein